VQAWKLADFFIIFKNKVRDFFELVLVGYLIGTGVQLPVSTDVEHVKIVQVAQFTRQTNDSIVAQ